MLIMSFIWILPQQVILAQEDSPPLDYPTYIIQPGDTLAAIAYRFGVSLDQLIEINDIENPGAISEGAVLIIPGLEGIDGVLSTEVIPLGEDIFSLSNKYQIPLIDLVRLNKITSTAEFYEGANLIIPIKEDFTTSYPIDTAGGKVTLLEKSALANLNPWKFAASNQLNNTWDFVHNQNLYAVGQTDTTATSFSPLIQSIEITPEELTQGGTAEVRVITNEPLNLTGQLNGYSLQFFPEGDNTYVAYQGIHALSTPGLTDFSLSGATENDETPLQFDQLVVIYDNYYASESLFVDPQTIDAATMDAEQALVDGIISKITPEKYWDGQFQCVVDQVPCVRSWFGTRRSYNDGFYYNFHSGIDYGICVSLNIYAPADGVVVFKGPLTVRGNTVYIDHGRGVFSGMFHQTETYVNEGDFVKAGQLIGLMGATGRVTGAHLHYEVIVNGVQVEPLDWLDSTCQ